jgi:FAD linked oxidases, C-terminal domain
MPEEQALWIYEEVERECKEATYKAFGSLSHHHGIGKIRKMFGKAAMGEA